MIANLTPAAPGEKKTADPTVWLQTALVLLAAVFVVRVIKPVLLPVLVGALLAFVFKPVHHWLERAHVHRIVGAALILALAMALAAILSIYLFDPALGLLASFPERLDQAHDKLLAITGPLERLRQIADKVSRMWESGEVRTSLVVRSTAGAGNVLGVAQSVTVQGAMALLVLFFLLAYRRPIYQKLAHQIGTVSLIREIGGSISAYLLTITIINIVLGMAEGFAMLLLGMPNPFLWGLMCFGLNFIPYLGAAAGTLVVFVVALTTFESTVRVLLVPLVYFVITSLEGSLITPMILGERFRVNPIVIFLWLLFWGWMWGIPGTFLAVPLLMAFKIVCDHVSALARIGELMRLD